LSKVKVSLDAMGGDNAPRVVVKGALMALDDPNVEIFLVGKVEQLEKELKELTATYDKNRLKLIDAKDVVEMAEKPTDALRKKESSLYIAANMVKKGEADALVSAGNTGAVLAVAMFVIGRIKGIERPAIATPLPSTSDFTVLIDSGANALVKPHHYLDFAKMGTFYAQLLGKTNPTVGLLNIGEEEEKGTDDLREAYLLLKNSLKDRFFGNVQGRDINNGVVDVVVTDGFTGNVVLKGLEGAAKFITTVIKKGISENGIFTKLGALMMKKVFDELRNKLDYRNYGGAFLLGVNGVTVIAHGSSDELAIKNAINVAVKGVKMKIVDKIKESVENS